MLTKQTELNSAAINCKSIRYICADSAFIMNTDFYQVFNLSASYDSIPLMIGDLYCPVLA
jgi:hypothetical protein